MHLGWAPAAVTAAYGSVWVATHRGGDILRIDPASNTVVGDVADDSGGFAPVALAGRLWATGGMINLNNNQIIPTRVSNYFAEADGLLWALEGNSLVGRDPRTYRLVRRYPAPNPNARKVSSPDLEITYGDGSFWAITEGDDTGEFGGVVLQVDPRTGKVVHTYRPPNPGTFPEPISYWHHAIWLVGADTGRLLRLDTQTGASKVFALPGHQPLTSLYPQSPAFGLGDVWVRVRSSTVLRIDPNSGKIVGRYPASPTGHGGYLAVAFGSLWICNFDDDTVWRDRVAPS